MTLSALYTNYLDKNNIEYDIVYIDKYDKEEGTNAKNVYRWNLNIKKKWGFLRKLLYYWKFKRFATDILLKNNYDFLIVWNEFTAFMFAAFLKKHFSNRYSINIRDYHYFRFPPVKHRLKRVITSSSFSTVASKAFIPYLPQYDYVVIHSLNKKLVESLNPREKLQENTKPIRILYLGYLNYPENVCKVIDQIENDNRFVFELAGVGVDIIKKYVLEKKINNVIVHGPFEPKDTASFLENADILYSLYDVGNKFVDTALSTKLYYATYLNIPIIVFKDTFMENVSGSLKIGFSVKKNMLDGMADNLYNWYHTLDMLEIKKNCSDFINEIERSHQELEKNLVKYLLSRTNPPKENKLRHTMS